MQGAFFFWVVSLFAQTAGCELGLVGPCLECDEKKKVVQKGLNIFVGIIVVI